MKVQRLVRCVELDGMQLRSPRGIESAGFHEGEALRDPLGEFLEALALWAGAHEIGGPAVHLVKVGETALGQRTQEVERGRGMRVCGEQPRGIGTPG
jgi:hypothetical protein